MDKFVAESQTGFEDEIIPESQLAATRLATLPPLAREYLSAQHECPAAWEFLKTHHSDINLTELEIWDITQVASLSEDLAPAYRCLERMLLLLYLRAELYSDLKYETRSLFWPPYLPVFAKNYVMKMFQEIFHPQKLACSIAADTPDHECSTMLCDESEARYSYKWGGRGAEPQLFHMELMKDIDLILVDLPVKDQRRLRVLLIITTTFVSERAAERWMSLCAAGASVGFNSLAERVCEKGIGYFASSERLRWRSMVWPAPSSTPPSAIAGPQCASIPYPHSVNAGPQWRATTASTQPKDVSLPIIGRRSIADMQQDIQRPNRPRPAAPLGHDSREDMNPVQSVQWQFVDPKVLWD